jgi:hypothetical protein
MACGGRNRQGGEEVYLYIDGIDERLREDAGDGV